MRDLRKILIITLAITMLNCASGYEMIHPESVQYDSKNEAKDLILEYKYEVLEKKKYAKKEIEKGVKLVAVKLTNNTAKDFVFGQDITLNYGSGEAVQVLSLDKTFNTLKQQGVFHLFYLLLTPMNFTVTQNNGNGIEETSSTPIGLVLGPGLAAGNMIAAGSANNNFKTELQNNIVYGKTIKAGETKYGLIGVKSKSYGNLVLNVK